MRRIFLGSEMWLLIEGKLVEDKGKSTERARGEEQLKAKARAGAGRTNDANSLFIAETWWQTRVMSDHSKCHWCI